MIPLNTRRSSTAALEYQSFNIVLVTATFFISATEAGSIKRNWNS
jgi:hypothetical protein